MSVRIAQNGTSVPPTQVWSGLTTECQALCHSVPGASRVQSRDRRVNPNPPEVSR